MSGDLRDLEFFKKVPGLIDDSHCQRFFQTSVAQLEKDTFSEVACSHTIRFHFPEYMKCLFNFKNRYLGKICQIFQRNTQISIDIEASDEQLNQQSGFFIDLFFSQLIIEVLL
jgi:hypothetical protein